MEVAATGIEVAAAAMRVAAAVMEVAAAAIVAPLAPSVSRRTPTLHAKAVCFIHLALAERGLCTPRAGKVTAADCRVVRLRGRRGCVFAETHLRAIFQCRHDFALHLGIRHLVRRKHPFVAEVARQLVALMLILAAWAIEGTPAIAKATWSETRGASVATAVFCVSAWPPRVHRTRAV